MDMDNDNDLIDSEPLDDLSDPLPPSPSSPLEEMSEAPPVTSPPPMETMPPLPPIPPISPIEPPTASAPYTESKTRGRARARHEQRKRQQQAGGMTSRVNVPRQIRPMGQFQLPQIKLPPLNRNILGIVGAVVVIGIVVYVLGRLRNNPIASYPDAIWIGTEWTQDAPTDVALTTLATGLKERQIGTIYSFVSWLQLDGTWSGEDKFENIKTFVANFKEAYPEADLYGWVSLPTESAPGVTRIDDEALQQQVADFSKRVVEEFGFDGVFLNAEPVWDGDEGYLALLRKVRAAVGLDTPVAAAIPPDWSPANATIPVPPLILPGTEWEKTYKQSVALLVDQLAVMVYNSGLASPDEYSQWVAYQVKTYAEAVAELNTDIDVIIGIPTYPADLPAHDPAVENIDSAVRGVRAGLDEAGDAANYVRGVAVFAEWETDTSEWDAYDRAWLEK